MALACQNWSIIEYFLNFFHREKNNLYWKKWIQFLAVEEYNSIECELNLDNVGITVKSLNVLVGWSFESCERFLMVIHAHTTISSGVLGGLNLFGVKIIFFQCFLIYWLFRWHSLLIKVNAPEKLRYFFDILQAELPLVFSLFL